MRYLIVGLGNIGRKRMAVLGPRCAATVDPVNPEADYEAAWDCPESAYDAVILAVPNSDKLGLLKRFVEAGKPVLVEKPLIFERRAEAEALLESCRANGATWYTSYNHRFETLIQALEREIAAGWLGSIYSARLFYGNGTVRHVKESWRDAGLGVVEDLGCHLLDLAGWLFGCRGTRFFPWALQRCEAGTYDHAILGSQDGRYVLEMSLLSWKNTFAIDVTGERGSLHLRGLGKWGPAELVVRERVLPSGVPHQRRERASGPDPTWARDIEHFEDLVRLGESPIENDWWISETMHGIVES